MYQCKMREDFSKLFKLAVVLRLCWEKKVNEMVASCKKIKKLY